MTRTNTISLNYISGLDQGVGGLCAQKHADIGSVSGQNEPASDCGFRTNGVFPELKRSENTEENCMGPN